MRLKILFSALALAWSGAAAAHSFWLQPVEHNPNPRDEVLVEFKVGDAGDVSDWGLYWERIASLRIYGESGSRDLQQAVRTTADGEAGTALVTMRGPGTYVVAFESNPSFSDLEAERFNRYLDHEGLDAIAAHRKARGTEGQSGTELYARRAKSLIMVGESPTENVTKPIGQTLEIVPLVNPYGLANGEPLMVQVLWRGEPLAGASVNSAALDETGKATTIRTDESGIASVPVARGSTTLVSVVWGVPAPNDARADYFTIFASLTF
ncbi:MAG: DUF4198 domain-containing protein [Pseudomonadota bacterium]